MNQTKVFSHCRGQLYSFWIDFDSEKLFPRQGADRNIPQAILGFEVQGQGLGFRQLDFEVACI